ncbi:MAG TPA: hypothetical protein VMV38_02460 [Candidatus Paceibacterota bacterium]|nr:hypothetical protein [Candidatus Paceibacterota bacterium]
MIYLFYGTDAAKVRQKAFEWVGKARAKEPNVAYIRLAREELSRATLEDTVSAGGLFVKRLLILIDDPFPVVRSTDEEVQEENAVGSVFEEYIDRLVESDNAIVVLAPRLPSLKAKKLHAKAKLAYVFDTPAARVDARGWNSGLVNALAARSRDKLWLEINRALRQGDAPEMIHGLLHWEARDLLLKGSRTWTPDAARKLSLDLIELLQSSRRGGLDLSRALEYFALSI